MLKGVVNKFGSRMITNLTANSKRKWTPTVSHNWDWDRSWVLGWRYHASQLINPGIAISIVSGRELVHFAILDTSDNFERVPDANVTPFCNGAHICELD